MTGEEVLSAKNAYYSYVSDFRDESGDFPTILHEKLRHSEIVAKDCSGIAADLNWTDDDIRTAEAIGLLHDIGRFPQFVKYGSIFDPMTENHGELGFKVLSETDILSECSETEREVLLTSVRFHNSKEIPEDIDPSVLPFLKLIRDADKLDIYRHVRAVAQMSGRERYKSMIPNMSLDGPPNPKLVALIRAGKQASYKDLRSFADLQLIQLGWVYAFNYRPSYVRLKERGILEKLSESLPEDPDVREAVNAAMSFLIGTLQDSGFG